MNILILNDTSKYHSGSLAVMRFLKSHFAEHNIELVKKISKIKNLDETEAVVINGEGTMHDNAEKFKEIMNFAVRAKHKGAKVILVNSVWQNNDLRYTRLLEEIDYISVREIKSKKEINAVIDKEVDVNLDLSFYLDVPIQAAKSANIVAGNYYRDGKERLLITGVGEDAQIDLFSQTWESVVNKLRNSSVLVTGRHHEMYAACKARCPFVVLESNTHKNNGLIETFNCNIPVLPFESSISDIKEAINNIDILEYNKLFDLMQNTIKPNFLDKVQN